MKYTLLIILFLIGCEKNYDKPNVQISNKTDTLSVIKNEKNVLSYPVGSLAEAIEFSTSSVMVDNLNYLDPIDLASVIEDLQVPNNKGFLKSSLDNFKDELINAEGYVLDFTNDSVDDLIYMSNYGSEGTYTVLWEKYNNSYRYVNLLNGSLVKLFRYSDKDNYSLMIFSGFYFGESYGEYIVYIPTTKNNYFNYGRKVSYIVFENLEAPSEVSLQKKFVIENSKCSIRLIPSFNDTIESNEDIQIKLKNIVAEFDIGSKGIAISSKDNSSGTWLFVIMDDSSSTLYKSDKGKSCIVGWLDAKSIKEI